MEPGKRSAPGALPGSTGVRFFDAFWHRLGDFVQFLGPLKIQGVPKTAQQNSIRRLLGVWKRPKGAKKVVWRGLKITLIFEWIFNGCWLYFGLIFKWFSCFFHCLFEAVFLMFFFSFLDRSLNSANPKIIEISLVLLSYFALDTFRRRSIFGRISDEFWYHFRVDFH